MGLRIEEGKAMKKILSRKSWNLLASASFNLTIAGIESLSSVRPSIYFLRRTKDRGAMRPKILL